MLTLTLPTTTTGKVRPLSGGLLGLNFNSQGSDGESISRRSAYDFLNEGRGNFHENNVVHRQLAGSLSYEPLAVDIVPAPTESAPFRIAVKNLNNFVGSPIETVYSTHGLIQDGGYSCTFGTSSFSHVKWEVKGDTIFKWEVYGRVDTPFQFFLSGTEWKPYRESSYRTYYDYRIHSFPGVSQGWISAVNWSKVQSLGSVETALQSSTPSARAWMQLAGGYNYGLSNARAFSPTSWFQRIDTKVSADLIQDFSLDEVPYGDLAQSASQQVNANNVNMLEFLSELRNPLKMFPKLKNLRNIKNMANDYLAIKYGLLPTIDDIKSIVEAVQRRKPYFDRNGFKTYSAGASSSDSINGVDVDLTQRIKLAISREDSGLDAIISGLDNIGTLPTLENVWDLIPFSFVVDWLVDVGGLLERADSRERITRLNIRYATMSRKVTTRKSFSASSSFPFTGTVELVHYSRWVSDQVPEPPLTLQTTFQDFDRWVEAGALLIARSKR